PSTTNDDSSLLFDHDLSKTIMYSMTWMIPEILAMELIQRIFNHETETSADPSQQSETFTDMSQLTYEETFAKYLLLVKGKLESIITKLQQENLSGKDLRIGNFIEKLKAQSTASAKEDKLSVKKIRMEKNADLLENDYDLVSHATNEAVWKNKQSHYTEEFPCPTDYEEHQKELFKKIEQNSEKEGVNSIYDYLNNNFVNPSSLVQENFTAGQVEKLGEIIGEEIINLAAIEYYNFGYQLPNLQINTTFFRVSGGAVFRHICANHLMIGYI
ncbi:10753_t:CDS:2, partial [Ambispora gerdemannii]